MGNTSQLKSRLLLRLATVVVGLAIAASLLLPGCGKKLAKVGEKTGNGNVALIVNSVTFVNTITDFDEMLNKKPADVFAIVDATVENIKGESLAVSKDDFKLAVAGADEPIGARAEKIITSEQINKFDKPRIKPGENTHGVIVYEVAAGLELGHLEYEEQGIEVGLAPLKATAPPDPTPVGMGQLASGGGIQFLVNSLTYTDKIPITNKLYSSISPGDGKKGCLVEVTVVNVSASPDLEVSDSRVVLIGSTGTEYEEPGALFINDRVGRLPDTRLAPGQQTTGNVYFFIPPNEQIATVRFSISLVGPPVQVSVK